MVRFIGMVGQPHRNFMKMASWSSVSEHLVNPIGMSDQLKWNNHLEIYERISIHAPIVGCDMGLFFCRIFYHNFNPRTHRGVRPLSLHIPFNPLTISIHAPIVGCDLGIDYSDEMIETFQSTHPSWGATL